MSADVRPNFFTLIGDLTSSSGAIELPLQFKNKPPAKCCIEEKINLTYQYECDYSQ